MNIRSRNYNIELSDKNKDISIKSITDMHVCDTFNDKIFDELKRNIYNFNPDYLCFVGDIIDSTNFTKYNHEKRKKLLEFFRSLSSNYKTFVTKSGGHDLALRQSGKRVKDCNLEFWNEFNTINNLFISQSTPYYEDDYVCIVNLETPFEYYYNESGKEDKEMLKELLKGHQNHFNSLNNHKIKILLKHSPIYISDSDILELIKDFDIILCGHMHNGMVLPILDKIFPKNRGIIAPNKSLYPDNARGIKEISYNGKKIYLIINPGITKLQECSGLSSINFFFPKETDNIIVKTLK